MISTPWAILLCKFKDDASEPYPRKFYEDLFTSSGAGTHNMVDYFSEVSHGTLDLSGSQVFGWYALDQNRGEYAGSGANPSGRNDLLNWGKQKAIDNKVPLSSFFNVVVCLNVPTDLFGFLGGVVCDNGADPADGIVGMSPSLLGQEMGHGYGLHHSRAVGSLEDYKDPWDVMSTKAAFMTPHPVYTQRDVRGRPMFWIGPILNAANMTSRGWIDVTRVWQEAADYGSFVQLRPLNRHDLPGYLAARVGNYFIEFRMNEGSDAGIPEPAVLIHEYSDDHSYLVSGTSAGTSASVQDLGAGDYFQLGHPDNPLDLGPGLKIEVTRIDAVNRAADLHIVVKKDQRRFAGPGIPFGGVTRGGEGIVFVNGKIRRIPPHTWLISTLEHIAAVGESESIENATARDMVRRDSLSAIVRLAEEQLHALSAYREPAKSVLPSTLEVSRQYETQANLKQAASAGSSGQGQ